MFIPNILKAEASEKLKEEVDKELKKPDPAKAAKLEELAQKEDENKPEVSRDSA